VISRYESDPEDFFVRMELEDLRAQAVPPVMRAVKEAWGDRDTHRLVYLTYILSELDMDSDPSLADMFEPGSRLGRVGWGDSWEEVDRLCHELFTWWNEESYRYPSGWNVFQRRMSPARAPPR
jgi:hypothetical protein